MVVRARATRVRYPLHAVLAVAATVLLFVFNLVVGFLFMALVPPLIPVYITVLFAGVCLVRTAVEHARRVSVRLPAAMLRPGKHDEEDRSRRLDARAA